MKREMRSFNTYHPELKEGEMFLTNVFIGSSSDFRGIGWGTKRKGERAYTIEGASLDGYVQDFRGIGWGTKRKGERAYTIEGASVDDCAPVFVQRKEYEEGMKKHERERRKPNQAK